MLYMSAIREHGVNLRGPSLSRGEDQMQAFRSPGWIFVPSHAVRQLNRLALADVHDEDIEIARFVAARPCESDELAIGAPGWIGHIAFAGSQHLQTASVDIHSPQLLMAGPA